MPMTEQGFHKLTYAEILEQQIIRAKDLFGNDMDTSEKSVLGKYIRLNASDFAQQEEALEQVYLSRYIDTAYGISLDRLAPFAGIARNAAVSAVIHVIFANSGSADVVIPMNTKIINQNGVLYHTMEQLTIEPGERVVKIECDETGTIGNAVSDMQFYNTQIPNVTVKRLYGLSVLCGEIYRSGEETETDAELRLRWKKAISGSGSGTINAIIGAVSKIDSVRECAVYENDTDSETNMLAPHSFTVVVRGGEGKESEIASAIFEKKPLGIHAYVDIPDAAAHGTVTDVAGNKHMIQFYHASPENVKVKITISKINQPDFDEDSARPYLEAALSEYFATLKIGEAVYARKLYLPIIQTEQAYCVENIQVCHPIVDKIIYGSEAHIWFGSYAVLDSVEIEVIE